MKHLEIIDQPDGVRALVGECELTGNRTAFDRNGRPVALLLSWDEYLALRETIDVSNDAALIATIRRSEAEASRDALEQPLPHLERIRVPRSLAARALAAPEPLRAALAAVDDDPIAGAPLFEPLRGIWSRLDGGFRILYRIVPEALYVVILAIREAETP